MTEERWPADWMRAVLPLSMLRIVADEESYGYVIAKRLENAGFGRIKGGTLYPILGRLEADRLVTSSWREGDGGPGRKYFAITAEGRASLDDRADRWTSFAHMTAELLSTRGAPA